MAVSSLEQDQSECQIECQNSAREGLSRACECLRALVFFEVSAVYLRQ
jgi:flavin-binding protein dodecin